MKIKYLGVKYNGNFTFVSGQTRDIPDDEANRLLKDFPNDFIEVVEKVENKESKSFKSKKNKSMKPEEDK